jgi:hypothetical protein
VAVLVHRGGHQRRPFVAQDHGARGTGLHWMVRVPLPALQVQPEGAGARHRGAEGEDHRRCSRGRPLSAGHVFTAPSVAFSCVNYVILNEVQRTFQ